MGPWRLVPAFISISYLLKIEIKQRAGGEKTINKTGRGWPFLLWYANQKIKFASPKGGCPSGAIQEEHIVAQNGEAWWNIDYIFWSSVLPLSPTCAAIVIGCMNYNYEPLEMSSTARRNMNRM